VPAYCEQQARDISWCDWRLQCAKYLTTTVPPAFTHETPRLETALVTHTRKRRAERRSLERATDQPVSRIRVHALQIKICTLSTLPPAGMSAPPPRHIAQTPVAATPHPPARRQETKNCSIVYSCRKHPNRNPPSNMNSSPAVSPTRGRSTAHLTARCVGG
jgi:hypothetical protein